MFNLIRKIVGGLFIIAASPFYGLGFVFLFIAYVLALTACKAVED